MPAPNKRTKIVATIGPSSSDEAIIRQMIISGMNVARINFSHGSHETHAANIAKIRSIADELGIVVAVLGDLQGPKIRLGDFSSFRIVPGDVITFTDRPDFDLGKNEIPLPHPEFIKDVEAGQRLLLDDGELEMRVLAKNGGRDLVSEVILPGELKQRKGISAPESRLTLPAITNKDRRDLIFAIEQDLDWIAMSFVRSAEDVRRLRYLIEDSNGAIPIVSKIEKFEALENIEEIVSVSDGVMVARGDLGVETPAAEVPLHQKRIIRLCNKEGKPVITATQMLSSMVDSPRPTRAEASDVANAIFDGTDAVMLSNESASGKYPVDSVKTMTDIAQNAERELELYGKDYLRTNPLSAEQETDMAIGRDNITSDAVSHATVQMALAVRAKLIVCSTWTGYTARRVARERSAIPIVCVTPNIKTYRRLALVWGVTALLTGEYRTIDGMFKVVEEATTQAGLVEPNDKIVIISGVPFGVAGATNFVKIHSFD